MLVVAGHVTAELAEADRLHVDGTEVMRAVSQEFGTSFLSI